jgi:hypothetical protein
MQNHRHNEAVHDVDPEGEDFICKRKQRSYTRSRSRLRGLQRLKNNETIDKVDPEYEDYFCGA